MKPLRLIPLRLRKFARVGGERRALLIEAAFWLLTARLALLFLPFPRIAGRLGTFVPAGDPRVLQAKAAASPKQVRLAGEIGWAVTRAARHVPFKAVCLPQAMAAQIMLRRRGVASVMRFGAVRATEKTLEAHAWLDAAGVEVTGYPVAGQFVEIACFI